jgi:hypothetical protein
VLALLPTATCTCVICLHSFRAVASQLLEVLQHYHSHPLPREIWHKMCLQLGECAGCIQGYRDARVRIRLS